MYSMIQAAGWPIWPLLLCSVCALALILERAFSLRDHLVYPPELLEQTLATVRKHSVTLEVIDSLKLHSPLGRVLAEGLLARFKSERFSVRQVEDALEEAGRRVAHELNTWLPALATIASIAPLLGLLGTVIGMIEIFGAQAPGSNSSNPIVLAHGISIALYNTAFGLIVCVPSLVAHRLFRSRVDAHVLQLESAARRLVDELSLTAAERASPEAARESNRDGHEVKTS